MLMLTPKRRRPRFVTTVTARSNATETVSGSPAYPSPTGCPKRSEWPLGTPDKRSGYPSTNTMANRRHGGGSMYYRMREGYGQ
jgi:hypothetical protein